MKDRNPAASLLGNLQPSNAEEDGVAFLRAGGDFTGAVVVSGSAPSAPVDGVAWLDTAGSSGVGGTLAIRTVTTDYTLLASDTVVLVDATSGDVTTTLPAASDDTGKVFYVKKIDSTTNTVTIDGASADTIDGGETLEITLQYETVTIATNGTSWFIL